jgi:hypothetical protein
MSLYKSSFKGYGCPYTNPALRVTDIPINPETKPRLGGLDRLDLLSLPYLRLYKLVALTTGLSPGKIRSKLLCSLSGF